MILNRKRVYVEKMEAVAAAEAKTEARVKAELKAWYDVNKDKMVEVPPPPGLDDEVAANNVDRH